MLDELLCFLSRKALRCLIILVMIGAVLLGGCNGSKQGLISLTPEAQQREAERVSPIQLFYDGAEDTVSEADVLIAFAISQGISDPMEIRAFVSQVFSRTLTSDELTVTNPLSISDFDCDGTDGTVIDAAIINGIDAGIGSGPDGIDRRALEDFVSDLLQVTVTIPDECPLPEELEVMPTPPPTSPPVGAFDLEVVFVDNTLTASQQAIVRSAAARWEQVITGDLTDTTVNLSQGVCENTPPIVFPSQDLSGRAVDDILIEVTAAGLLSGTQFNEVGGAVAQAGPCGFFRDNNTPNYGRVGIDPADLDQLEAGELETVIIHEIGHILGIGTLWDPALGFTSVPDFVSNNRFVGPQGQSAFNMLGGTGGVPLEDDDGHWSESTLDNELMTPVLIFGFGGPENPLSRITAGALLDLGYTVNLNAADPYTLPMAPGLAERRGDRIPLGDDIVVGPFFR